MVEKHEKFEPIQPKKHAFDVKPKDQNVFNFIFMRNYTPFTALKLSQRATYHVGFWKNPQAILTVN